MQFKRINKIPLKGNVAVVINKTQDLPTDILSAEESKYAAKQLKENPENWVTINQYSRLVFVRLAPKTNTAEETRKAGASLAKLLNSAKQTSVSIRAEKHIVELAEGAALGNYQYLRYFKDKAERKHTLATLNLLHADAADLEKLVAVYSAVCQARDLVNTPVWDLTAPQLAEKAVEAGKNFGFNVQVLDKKKIEELKMGGVLAVNKGSIDPPAFIIMEHKPANATNKKPVVFVGKGIVYDTGGLSLKPSTAMDTMKSDMGGSAAVIGAMSAIAAAKLPVHVVGLVPTTDNRPGGNAVTPGDVITMMDGTTVEVMNTDAEGRLILADALHYAKKYNPELVIDLATLTGSAAMAIGKYGIVGMGTASEKVFKKLQKSGENTYERIVEFPFWDEYDELLKSPIADLKNIGTREGGAITAGKFLANFTNYPYIHLDIAGPAFVDANAGYIAKGGTGVGVRLLFDFINNY